MGDLSAAVERDPRDDPTVVAAGPPPVGAQRGPEPGLALEGRYVLEEPLGSGGAATVWRAYDEVLDRSVAIKILHPHLATDPATVERFHREARAAARITHPHAVAIYDVGEEGDLVYLIMEYVDGPTLADLLRRHGPLDPGAVAALGEQVASALGDAHAQGLVHRDVKPSNILLTSEGVAKLTDFGIAKALHQAAADLTDPGTVIGTAAYVAPEQLRPGAEVDGRTDVYALGVVLFECLTGRPPFAGDDPTEVAAARLEQEVPAPRQFRADVPRLLDEVVVRATRRDPAQRFADGYAMARALAPLVATRPSDVTAALVAPAGVLPSLPAAETRLPRWLLLLLGAVLLAGVAVLATRSLGPPPPPPAPAGALPVAAVGDLDPFGPDRAENPERAAAAVDGDPATAWLTERYRGSPRLGNLKPGVGLWVDLGAVYTLEAVELTVPRGPVTVTVYATAERPDLDAPDGTSVLESWGPPVAGPVEVTDTATVALGGARARFVLLWLTSLAPTDDGRFQGGISEAVFRGR